LTAQLTELMESVISFITERVISVCLSIVSQFSAWTLKRKYNLYGNCCVAFFGCSIILSIGINLGYIDFF